MSFANPTLPPHSVMDNLQELRGHWWLFLVMGILLILAGTFGLGAVLFMTLASMYFFGWMLVITGGLEVGHALWIRNWRGFFVNLAGGVLHAVVGFLILTHPTGAALALTLLLAAFFMIGGLFRMIAALAHRFPSWGWAFLVGLVNFLLGLMIWRDWPLSGLWVPGTFVSIDLLISGWAYVMLALSVKRL